MSIRPPLENSVNLPGDMTIYPSQEKAIDCLLSDLMEKCPGELALLVHVSGQIISLKGERGTADLPALGSLVAGDLAASREIARLTDQYQNSQMIIREGKQTKVFITEAGRKAILFARVSEDVPLGWARLLIRECSCKLAQVIDAQPEELQKLDFGLPDEKLTGLVGDDLDSIWKG